MNVLLECSIIKTKRRLTFDITNQDMTFCGKSDDDYLTFKASNGVEIISRSRMDIQTDRLWLLGCGPDERSGSMVFSSDAKRDKMYNEFVKALSEWAKWMVATYYPDKFVHIVLPAPFESHMAFYKTKFNYENN